MRELWGVFTLSRVRSMIVFFLKDGETHIVSGAWHSFMRGGRAGKTDTDGPNHGRRSILEEPALRPLDWVCLPCKLGKQQKGGSTGNKPESKGLVLYLYRGEIFIYLMRGIACVV